MRRNGQKSGAIQKERKLKREAEYNVSPNKCKECGQNLPYPKRHNKFCSIKCGSTSSNKSRKKPTDPCKVCGKPIPRSNEIYCSKDCQHEDREIIFYFDIQGWLNNEIEGGTNTNPLGGCRSAVRRYLLEESGYKCSKCGWNEVHPVTGKVPLEINHIDGDAHNNKRENLEVLCPNCHSLTPNYRALNKKSSRTHR